MSRALLLASLLTLAACGSDETAPPPATPAGVDTSPVTGSSTGTTGSWQPDVSESPDVPSRGVDTEHTWTPPACTAGVPCNDGDACSIDDQCLEEADGFYCRGTLYVCDDDRPCTGDVCDGEGGCDLTITDGWCLLNNTCLEHGAISPSNACARCDTDSNKIAWSELAEDAACDDGDPCSFGDYCDKGVCRGGLPAVCNDDNACTDDACVTDQGCANTPRSGPCDDGDPCTAESACSGGVCHAPAGTCDDGNPCTTDTCLPELGCAFVAFEGACEDGDACTAGDQCTAEVCVAGPPTDCSDGSQCTVDLCNSVFGCYLTLTGDPCCSGAAHVCDDGDACTTDGCVSDGGSGCEHTLNSGPCSDGDQCTVGDSCSGGVCQSGGASPCDDGNPCTSDLCNPAGGCQHVIQFGGCDDGIPCTTGDTCQDGQCKGDSSECKCEPDFAPTVGKATLLELSATGHPGDGLDVDENPGTCAPASGCSGGVDNTLGVLSGFVNENLVKEVNSGGLVLLFELMDPKTDGTPFEMRLYPGKKANSGCDHTQGGCSYLIDKEGLDETCAPLISIPATITQGKLKAGGPGTSFSLLIPLFGSTYLPVLLFDGAAEGDIEINGDEITITNGVLAGAVPKSVFISALELVPENQLPAPKETIAQLLDVLVKNDVDTGPPAGPDAASIGLRFEAKSGVLVGVD